MLFVVILEVLVVAGVAMAVLKDEKKLSVAFDRWMGGKKRKPIVYHVPLTLVMREQIKEAVQKGPKHRYVH